MKRGLETVSTVLVILAASALLYQTVGQGTIQTPPPPAAAVAELHDTLDASFVRNTQGTGTIAVVEFTDFQCPFCARHAHETVPTLAAMDGVRYVSLHFPLTMHAHALVAAKTAECAAQQGQFWPMHAALFTGQDALGAGIFPRLTNLDHDRLARCVSADSTRARVEADQQEGKRLKVRSTPTIFLGRMRSDGGIDLARRLEGAQPVETFVAEITKLITG